MKKSIVTGSTGLLGTAVIKRLLTEGVDVLCLGRSPVFPAHHYGTTTSHVTYIPLPMEKIGELPQRIKGLDWDVGDSCVFYHFAWGGDLRLTDGDLETQLLNATQAAYAVKAAKVAGCAKFINVGSLEETCLELFLDGKLQDYQFEQSNYGISKLAGRDLCRLVAYIEKIDYVHTRLSVPLDPSLAQSSYVAKTLKSIIEGRPYSMPKNKNPVDIVSVHDVAYAYYLLGKHGLNQADYFVGSSHPVLLEVLFRKFEESINCLSDHHVEPPVSTHLLFSSDDLERDTGFVPPPFPFESLFRRVEAK